MRHYMTSVANISPTGLSPLQGVLLMEKLKVVDHSFMGSFEDENLPPLGPIVVSDSDTAYVKNVVSL